MLLLLVICDQLSVMSLKLCDNSLPITYHLLLITYY